MAAVLVEVADAVAAALNGHDFGIVFTAERSYADWSDDLPALKDVKVDVVPFNDLPTLDDVGDFDWPVTVDVLIRKKFDEFEVEQDTGRPQKTLVDDLLKFVEDVWEFLAPQQPNQTGRLTLASGLSAAWDADATRMVTHYVRKHLRVEQRFTGWIRVGYSVHKTVDE